jgi:hypothetical protein
MSKYTVTFTHIHEEERAIEANTLKELINRLLDKCDGRLEVKN